MFRFTIRDVLWLTALVAMGIGWWLDHAQNRRATEKLKIVEKMLQVALNDYEELTGRKRRISADLSWGEVSYGSQTTKSLK